MSKTVSGIMRVKNDGMFVSRCVESCIDALDELIIVYNDCTDNSAEEIAKMAAKYPDKIKSYAYPYHILGGNLTKEEYEYAKKLPDGHPSLLSTYCNFALSKVTSDYALKIDADQVYFTEQLKYWCDFLRNCTPQKLTLKAVAGAIFSYYVSLYRVLSLKMGKVLPMLPAWLVKASYPSYISYAKYLFSHDKACLAPSGVNVIEADETRVSMGHILGKFKAFHAFNGCGDTVIFKVGPTAKFEKFIMAEYSTAESRSYSVFEIFRAPCKKVMFIGFFWKHLTMMRPAVLKQVMELCQEDEGAFLTIDNFQKLGFKEIMNQVPGYSCPLFQQLIFSLVYKADKQTLIDNLKVQ